MFSYLEKSINHREMPFNHGMPYQQSPHGQDSSEVLLTAGPPHQSLGALQAGIVAHHYSEGSSSSGAAHSHHSHHLSSNASTGGPPNDSSYYPPGPPYCDTSASTRVKRKRGEVLDSTDDPLAVDWSAYGSESAAGSSVAGPSPYDPPDTRTLFAPSNGNAPQSNQTTKSLYASESYTNYLDGNEPWNGSQTSTYNPFTTGASSIASGLPGGPPAPAYIHDAMYDSSLLSSLPPMSSFRGAAPPPPSAVGYHHSSGSEQTTAGTPSSGPSLVSLGSQPTSDPLGKALASIYTNSATSGAEHGSSSYSGSAGSTPVSSPPSWTRVSTTTTFAPSTESPSAGHLHTLQSAPIEDRLEEAIHILRDHAEVGATRCTLAPFRQHSRGVMEERLDDAINILKTHAETPNYSHLTQLECHVVSYADVYQCLKYFTQPSPSSSDPGQSVSGAMRASMTPVSTQPSSVPQRDESATNSTSLAAATTGKKSTSRSVPNTPANNGAPVVKGSKRSRSSSSSGDEDDPPEIKAEREKERRQANNARERIRVRDINEAFKELGRMCMIHLKQDKAQTKLNILHQAVEVITSLEHQVRERNMNPKNACLKRREEEKSEEAGSNKYSPLHHTAHIGPSSGPIPPNGGNLTGLALDPSRISSVSSQSHQN
ncbi:transcription factor 12-like isoform X4 [Leptotrombidium deliense]|uniref:Transcription factor 12-like isoform X4 n=1 Tax=Leptotrombidium deliense TaxID=299467 RepID=A0A443SGK4_9ACAR|nr:transcription factor 12-like isoform X4 [Leptotrombidium deliense]